MNFIFLILSSWLAMAPPSIASSEGEERPLCRQLPRLAPPPPAPRHFFHKHTPASTEAAIRALYEGTGTLHRPTLLAHPDTPDILRRYLGDQGTLSILDQACRRHLRMSWYAFARESLNVPESALKGPTTPWKIKFLNEPGFANDLSVEDLTWLDSFLRQALSQLERGELAPLSRPDEYRLFGIYNHAKARLSVQFDQLKATSALSDAATFTLPDFQTEYRKIIQLEQSILAIVRPLVLHAVSLYVRRTFGSSNHPPTDLQIELLKTAAEEKAQVALRAFDRNLGFRFSTFLYRIIHRYLPVVRGRWVKQFQASADEEGRQSRWDSLAARPESSDRADDVLDFNTLWAQIDWEMVFHRIPRDPTRRGAAVFLLYYGIHQERRFTLTEIAEKLSLTYVTARNLLVKAQRIARPYLPNIESDER